MVFQINSCFRRPSWIIFKLHHFGFGGFGEFLILCYVYNYLTENINLSCHKFFLGFVANSGHDLIFFKKGVKLNI